MYTQNGLTIIEWFEPIQRRPAMYIGVEEPGRSPSYRRLEGVVDAIANDTPPPREIRIGLWSGAAMTIAWDGMPLPVEPFTPRGGGASHPALYQLFMYLAAGAPPFGRFFFGAILNALSERLVVSTIHGGHPYRVVFAKGLIVTLLQRTNCREHLGTTWLTFRPDRATIGGDHMTWDSMQHITTQQETRRISAEDHSEE